MVIFDDVKSPKIIKNVSKNMVTFSDMIVMINHDVVKPIRRGNLYSVANSYHPVARGYC